MSIAAVLRDPEAHLPREAVFNFFPHGGPAKPPGVTVRKGRWKLIHWFDTSRNYPDEFELYDLEKDIGESQNLAAEHPDVVKELRQLIDEFLADTNALVPQPNPDYDPDAPRRERPRRRNAAAGRR